MRRTGTGTVAAGSPTGYGAHSVYLTSPQGASAARVRHSYLSRSTGCQPARAPTHLLPLGQIVIHGAWLLAAITTQDVSDEILGQKSPSCVLAHRLTERVIFIFIYSI